MNSARRSSTAEGGRARKENAGAWPALEFGEDCAWLTDRKSADSGEGTNPQDAGVSFFGRLLLSTMVRFLWLSEFNVVIEFRCLINESSNST
jgi:hypothetical protein